MPAAAVSGLAVAGATRSRLNPPPPLPPPGVSFATSRCKDATRQKCLRSSRSWPGRKLFRCSSISMALPALMSCHPEWDLHSFSFQGSPGSRLFAASSHFFGSKRGVLSSAPMPSLRPRTAMPPRAYKYSPYGFRYPEIKEKPGWWWRTLACVPYLLALQLSDTGYYLLPFTERCKVFRNLIFFIPGAINRFPAWFSMIYCFTAFLLVVKNKDWPHYFRFHLMMGMLLEVALQVVWYVSNFMPLIHYNGTYAMQYWAAVAFAYIAILLECIRRALAGQYASIPFVSESAYIHTLFGAGLSVGGLGG